MHPNNATHLEWLASTVYQQHTESLREKPMDPWEENIFGSCDFGKVTHLSTLTQTQQLPRWLSPSESDYNLDTAHPSPHAASPTSSQPLPHWGPVAHFTASHSAHIIYCC